MAQKAIFPLTIVIKSDILGDCYDNQS